MYTHLNNEIHGLKANGFKRITLWQRFTRFSLDLLVEAIFVALLVSIAYILIVGTLLIIK